MTVGISLFMTLAVGMVNAAPFPPSDGTVVRQQSAVPFYTFRDMLGAYTRGRVTGADNLCPRSLLYTSVTPPDNNQTFSYRSKLAVLIAVPQRELTSVFTGFIVHSAAPKRIR